MFAHLDHSAHDTIHYFQALLVAWKVVSTVGITGLFTLITLLWRQERE